MLYVHVTHVYEISISVDYVLNTPYVV